tara:strand:+ start:556 stop:822 length:267 start_codon:yes stop_codon:yes gene_type:complete
MEGNTLMDDKVVQYDPVNKPKHYMLFPDMEAIELIEKVLSPAEFRGFMKGNILKYRLRAGNKDQPRQDLAKADWYQGELFAFMETEND